MYVGLSAKWPERKKARDPLALRDELAHSADGGEQLDGAGEQL
jgi:hypothetical protein